MNKPIVSVVKNQDIYKAVYNSLDNIILPDLNNKKILLKPNVGRNVGPRLGINTNPDVVEAIYNYLNERYKATFFIGDSPIIGVDTKEAFINSGYYNLINNPNIKFIDLDDKPPIILNIPNGKLIKSLKVTGYFYDFDYIISIPVLKMHMHTGASLSFKNMKGLLYKREKVKLHQLNAPKEIKGNYKELDIAISDMVYVIKPDLAIIDATYAQEGMGPSAGDTKKLDIIISSTNFLAADITALYIVKLDINHTLHLKLISEIINGPITITDIQSIPEDISSFQVDFKLPPKVISINYKNVNVIDINSCSACLSTLFLFIKNNIDLINEYFDEYNQLNIAIGKDIKDIPKNTFLLGNCTINKKNDGIFIQGCPPVQSAIKQKLEEFIRRSGLKKFKK